MQRSIFKTLTFLVSIKILQLPGNSDFALTVIRRVPPPPPFHPKSHKFPKIDMFIFTIDALKTYTHLLRIYEIYRSLTISGYWSTLCFVNYKIQLHNTQENAELKRAISFNRLGFGGLNNQVTGLFIKGTDCLVSSDLLSRAITFSDFQNLM